MRRHIRRLLDSGWTTAAIAAKSGMSQGGLGVLMWRRPPATKMRVDLAEAVLTLQPLPGDRPARNTGLVWAHGTRRRLQGLVANGWPLATVARRYHVSQISLWHYTQNRYVTTQVASFVRGIADDLIGQVNPDISAARRAASLAERRGWPPVEAWGDDIDDPTATPHSDDEMDSAELDAEAATSRALAGMPIEVVERRAVIVRTIGPYLAAGELPRTEWVEAVRRASLPPPNGPGLTASQIGALFQLPGAPRSRQREVQRAREEAIDRQFARMFCLIMLHGAGVQIDDTVLTTLVTGGSVTDGEMDFRGRERR